MKETLPVLPLRDIVVFPHMIAPLFVGREKSVAALESVMAAEKLFFLFPNATRLKKTLIVKRFMTLAWSRMCYNFLNYPMAPCGCW